MVEQSLGGNYGSMMLNIKTHVQGMGKVLYAYFLAVALGWAAFPIIGHSAVAIRAALCRAERLYIRRDAGIYLYSVHDDAWLRGIGQKTVPVGAL